MPFDLGFGKLALIPLVILLLFGAKRLPDIARGLGKGVQEFKKSVGDTTDEIKVSIDEEAPKRYGDSHSKDKGENSNH
ncbi:MAG: twin-arginine translocase TatA/TatE family subunit [Candidatus Zixiibacteriota bacterium]|nr:MAG: twin-arginine translocase TatA/TatE family subunit [candidate division Zixibacteria bacterium]